MKGKVKKIMLSLTAVMYGLFYTNPLVALAADDDDEGVKSVTKGISTLKDIALACVGGVGVIFLAWGLLDFGTAYSAHDTSQQSAAIKKVVGGLIMIAVPSILKVLGAV